MLTSQAATDRSLPDIATHARWARQPHTTGNSGHSIVPAGRVHQEYTHLLALDEADGANDPDTSRGRYTGSALMNRLPHRVQRDQVVTVVLSYAVVQRVAYTALLKSY